MRRSSLMMLTLAAILTAGCGSSDSSKESYENLVPRSQANIAELSDTDQARVTKAITIAKEIRDHADQAQSILEKHGTTTEEFEAELYAISIDPQMAAVYNAALGDMK